MPAHRPDRIIFFGKEVKVTATDFSLIHLLAQHPEQVMSFDAHTEQAPWILGLSVF